MRMDILKHILPLRFFEILEKAGICTPKQIIVLSLWDIKKLTNLGNEDIVMLKNIVARNCSPTILNGLELQENIKISTRCPAIDKMLGGGFRIGTISEIYGESGTGKTQLAMQIAASCGINGSVYISTEEPFPVNRFIQISKNIWRSGENYQKNTFIEHITETQELLACVRVRLPKLLSVNSISTVVIDSVAAPFRCDSTNYIQRAEELRELAFSLLILAQKYNFAAICINQVAACFDGSSDVLPTLGLVWSNMISYRFKLKRIPPDLRELTIVFGPDIPIENFATFTITQNGIEDDKSPKQ